MASLYRDPTLEAPIDLVISRLIIEEEGESVSDKCVFYTYAIIIHFIA